MIDETLDAQAATPVGVAPASLYCPLPGERSPDGALVAQRSMAFLKHFGLCRDDREASRVRAIGAADWCCRVAPRADSSRLQIVSDWVHLGFVLDDQCFDTATPDAASASSTMLRLLMTIEHPEADVTGDPVAAAWRDISVRIRGRSGPAARRWADGSMDWFFAVGCLLAHRSAGTMPTLGQYVNLGPRDRGMRLVGALIEIAEDTFLSDRLRERSDVRACTQAAYLLVTIASDVYSFAKEAAAGLLESNAVGVIKYWLGCGDQDAMAEAAALHDRVMCRYLRLKEAIDPAPGSPLQTHLRQLDHLVRGNLDWSAQTARYRGETRRANPAISNTPSDAGTQAPGIPCIDWWWARACLQSIGG